MDSDRPKLSEIADECDDYPTQMEDEMRRRHFQACFLSIDKKDDELLLPGFRFHPTDEELVGFYLRRKVEKRPISFEFVKEVDIYKFALPRSTTHFDTKAVELPQLNCPRCDSRNTKFCYYNNYSISQPRHFCKTCRRYWTEGGTLRNIPGSSSAASKRFASDPRTVGYDFKEWYKNYQRGTKCRDAGPSSATGEPTGTNKPTYYSSATPSLPNYISIFSSMDNQPQPSEPPTNQHPPRPEMRINIFDGNTDLLTHQSWKEYKDQLKNSQSDDDAMKVMSGTLMAVAGQVIGGMMVYRITSSAANSYSWVGSAVEIATVLGLCVTLAGISLRGRSQPQSALTIKIGAVITASAIVFSMGLHLPPVMALTVGTVMFLIMAVAAAFA